MEASWAWVVAALIGGGVAGLVLAALFGAAKISEAEADADRWRRRYWEAERNLEKSRRELARWLVRADRSAAFRAAGERGELAATSEDLWMARLRYLAHGYAHLLNDPSCTEEIIVQTAMDNAGPPVAWSDAASDRLAADLKGEPAPKPEGPSAEEMLDALERNDQSIIADPQGVGWFAYLHPDWQVGDKPLQARRFRDLARSLLARQRDTAAPKPEGPETDVWPGYAETVAADEHDAP